MFRLWAKIFQNNRLLNDFVATSNNYNLSRTEMILQSIDDICYELDLAKPIWLDKNISEFKSQNKTRFYSDNFIENIDFDYLEIHIIEE